jgi:predicted nucleic acid-binding protein
LRRTGKTWQSCGLQSTKSGADRKLKKIGRSDLLIASITLANDAILVTRNLRHFRQVPHLQAENWVD